MARPASVFAAAMVMTLVSVPTMMAQNAQSPSQATEKTPPAPAKPTTPPPPEGKSLDDLLGLPSGKTNAKNEAKPIDDPTMTQAKDRLERQLDEKELDSLLQQALAGMRTSADQLGSKTDTGATTQRVQADVVAKLDLLIEEAKKRCKGGQCKSGGEGSGSSKSQSQKQSQANAQKPGEQPGEKKPGESKTKGDSKQAKGGNGQRAGDGPEPVDPNEQQAMLDESQAEWGMLPARVRDLIRQGSRDRIAALYQRLTEEYYRRMAEDASR